MELGKVQLGQDLSLDISIGGGKLSMLFQLSAQSEVDALMAKLKGSLPAGLQGIADMVQAAVDAELGK